MAGKKFITAEEAGRIWMLHEKGLTHSQIADVCGRSANTIYRVVGIYQRVRDGNAEALTAPSFQNSKGITAAAQRHFGVTAQTVEPVEPTKKTADVQDLLSEVRRTNELLERLISLLE